MLSVISAEALKLRGHRATWFLVWIFPIGALIIPLLMILSQLIQNSPPAPAAPEIDAWIKNSANFWSLPSGGLGRIFVTAFVALAFAGEYAWNTWKLIVPHRTRAGLIAAKFAVTLGFVLLAFLVADLLVLGLGWLEDVATGDPVPAGITAGALATAHLSGLAASLPAILLSAAIAALAAILSRSTAAALVIGIIIITVEQLFTAFAPMLALYIPGMESLFQLLPGYHLGNFAVWMVDGQGRVVPFMSGTTVAWSWQGSLAMLGAWIAGLTALTFWRFGRQDIN